MGWCWMFAACAAPLLLFFFSSLFAPKSPRWLAGNNIKTICIEPGSFWQNSFVEHIQAPPPIPKPHPA